MKTMIEARADELINNAILLELANICEVHGKKYSTNHEGYAVLKEEVEETMDNLTYMLRHLKALWTYCKNDNTDGVLSEARLIGYSAMCAAEEAVQCAAVCKKIGGNV